MTESAPHNIEEFSVTAVDGVSAQLAKKLEKIGITQVKDLVFHFPFRYQDKTELIPLGSIKPGQTATIQGQIVSVDVQYSGRRSLTVRIEDDSGRMTMRLFYFSNQQKNRLVPGHWIRCFGEVRRYSSLIQMIHPEYSTFQNEPPPIQSQNLTPVYRSTEGVTQNKMRSVVASALAMCRQHNIQDLLPPELVEEFDFPAVLTSLQYMHAPPNRSFELSYEQADINAYRRFIFEELLSYQIARVQNKRLRQAANAAAMNPVGNLSSRLRNSLHFEPTNSQRKVIHEVLRDLKRPKPMLRLVQGDVGSGKTLIAAAAAAWVVDCGCQVAIMAPTELLAEQHYRTFSEWFVPLDINVLLLTGRISSKERKSVEYDLRWRSKNIVVGTHALFQKSVEYQNLGLIVIDEQHRFGVGQRFALREKGASTDLVPHQLIMTATPIPRTLSMTMYSDLDVSSITELPPGRKAVKTWVFSARELLRIAMKVKEACAAGQQAYWVCPIIEKSEYMDVASATEAEQFVRRELPDLRIALVHGRLKSNERDKIMDQFRKGEIDVLVATTVIEVGVDVPNASFMVIESADRLGLAQLHQLRGRVGRGTEQAHCVLLYKGKISSFAKQRLSIMRETNDGFAIAETDLTLRGAGDLLGTRQTGGQLFKVAELPRDKDMIEPVNKAVSLLIDKYPQFISPLIRRWTPREGGYSAV